MVDCQLGDRGFRDFLCFTLAEFINKHLKRGFKESPCGMGATILSAGFEPMPEINLAGKDVRACVPQYHCAVDCPASSFVGSARAFNKFLKFCSAVIHS